MSEFRERNQDVPEGILGEGYRKELKRQADRKKRPCPRPWPNMCQRIHRLYLRRAVVTAIG